MDSPAKASPITGLALGLSEAKITSVKKKISLSPKLLDPGSSLAVVRSPSRSPLSSLNSEANHKHPQVQPKPLMRLGLRMRTPPGRCARRLVLDENSPLMASPSGYTLVVRHKPTPSSLFEESDNSSQDSAFSEASSNASFRFVEPSVKANSNKKISPRRCLKFCSMDSMDSACSLSGSGEDGFTELLGVGAICPQEDSLPLPSSTLGCLFSAEQLPTPKSRKRPHTLSGNFSHLSPARGKRAKKPLGDRAASENKGTLFQYGFTTKKAAPEEGGDTQAETQIKLALQRSTQEELIGDFSRPFALPLTPGKHQDLKAISCETLAHLLTGQFDDRIHSYKIIDCRYPYEYEGGHIRGAVNLYTCDDILKDLLQQTSLGSPPPNKRNILIFHCEFSSERGPFLSRFLRKEDRAGHDYPTLAYPECYLLHGGYKAFFGEYKQLCEPQTYRAMQDPAHSSDLKHFKAKSKTWAPGHHKRLTIRSLSRLGF